jgi:hypothetical protein
MSMQALLIAIQTPSEPKHCENDKCIVRVTRNCSQDWSDIKPLCEHPLCVILCLHSLEARVVRSKGLLGVIDPVCFLLPKHRCSLRRI